MGTFCRRLDIAIDDRVPAKVFHETLCKWLNFHGVRSLCFHVSTTGAHDFLAPKSESGRDLILSEARESPAAVTKCRNHAHFETGHGSHLNFARVFEFLAPAYRHVDKTHSFLFVLFSAFFLTRLIFNKNFTIDKIIARWCIYREGKKDLNFEKREFQLDNSLHFESFLFSFFVSNKKRVQSFWIYRRIIKYFLLLKCGWVPSLKLSSLKIIFLIPTMI